jgi:hypothetical protein
MIDWEKKVQSSGFRVQGYMFTFTLKRILDVDYSRVGHGSKECILSFKVDNEQIKNFSEITVLLRRIILKF